MRLDLPNISDDARFEQLDDAMPEGVVAMMECLDEEGIARLGGLQHGLYLRRIHRERLLAQHVLAGREGADTPFRVPVRWQPVVNEVDRVAFYQRGVVGLDAPNPMLICESACTRGVSRGNARDFDTVEFAGRSDDRFATDLRCPEQSDSYAH